MKIKSRFILIAILFFAAMLRFWGLGSVPPSPDWDEAALGYNAYSLLKTGRDEYGTFLPVTLRSFDDYKPPLYAYLAIPSVWIFGLSTWAVRLPSAVMGVIAVAGAFVLVRELFKKEGDRHTVLAHLTAFLLSISPWHIQFSRIAFEANIGVTLHIWAAALLLVGRTRPVWLLGSAFLSGLGLYAYHSERIFLPLLLIMIFFLWRRELTRHRKYLFAACCVGLITVAPLLTVFADPATLTRLRGTSSLADQTALLFTSAQRLKDDKAQGNPWGIVFDNRRLVWARTVLDGYVSHFSLRWLFLTGDNPRHHAPDMGLLYLWELPFVLWGIYRLFHRGGRSAKLIFGWFLISPIPASPTTELPHAIRAIVFLPTFQIFTALGVYEFFAAVRRYKWRGAITAVVLFIAVVNVAYYLHMYFGHTNHEFSRFWQYGYEQAVQYTRENREKYDKIVISTKLEQPHMFFLYYLRFDPAAYLSSGGTASGGFAEYKNTFDIYEFREIYWDKETRDSRTLFIGTPQEIGGTVLKTIYYLDGTEAMRIAQ